MVLLLTYRGIRLSSGAGVILGTFEIAAFLALALFMIVKAGDGNTLRVLQPAHALQSGWSGVFKGMVFAILAFIGFAAVVGWGFDRMGAYAADPDPWRTLAQRFWGTGWIVILLAIVNSAIANAVAGVVAVTRVMYAMGRVGVLPASFRRSSVARDLRPHLPRNDRLLRARAPR